MNIATLNNEIARELVFLSDSESYMKKALRSVRRLSAKKKMESEKASTVADLLIKQDIKDMCDQIKMARTGQLKGRNAEDILYELHD